MKKKIKQKQKRDTTRISINYTKEEIDNIYYYQGESSRSSPNHNKNNKLLAISFLQLKKKIICFVVVRYHMQTPEIPPTNPNHKDQI